MIKVDNTYCVKIYLSGPIEVAKQYIRKFCLEVGLCVTIEPTLFIYTGGEESGYVVGLLNYPKFPKSQEHILSVAQTIAEGLILETHQHSALVVTPSETYWFSNRVES